MARDTKKCIKDFIDHVDALAAEEDPEGNGFNREYRLIHEVQVKNRRDNTFTMDIGKSEVNMKKNRYKDILPYDECRIVLSEIKGEEGSNYINASQLMGVKGTGGYIASQGPLASTINDFWRMIWEKNVDIIFMACRIVEMGKIKCKQYWNDVDKSEQFGDITVFTETEEEVSSDFIRRDFRVTRGDETRHVIQFHYSGWPDHGIPDDASHIRDLIGIMRTNRQRDEVPLLVHCSAGCGRTGAIVAIDFVWTLLEEGRFDETFSLYELICNFREQRMSIVQTADQYALVNKVLKSLCEDWLTKMASHTYVNVELNQDYYTVDAEGTTVAKMEEENIYEDTEVKEVRVAPAETTDTESRLQGNSRNSGPEVIQLPKPSATPQVTSAQDYENIKVVEKEEPKNVPAPAPPVTSAPTNDKAVHKTVIQIGSSKMAPKQASSTGANSKEIINLVNSASALPSSSTTPPPPPTSQPPYGAKIPFAALGPNAFPKRASMVKELSIDNSNIAAPADKVSVSAYGPDGSVYSSVQRTAPPSSSSSSNFTSAEKVSVSTTGPDGSAYSYIQRGPPAPHTYMSSTVTNGTGQKPSVKDAKDGRGGSVRKGSTSSIGEDAWSRSAGRKNSSSGDRSAKQASLRSKDGSIHHTQPDFQYVTIAGTKYEGFVLLSGRPGTPPGFNERLPRVRGPVPEPESWSKR